MTSPVVFDSLDPEDLASSDDWWDIYYSSFPEGERESREMIERGVRMGRGMVIEARRQNECIGISATTLLLHPPAVFLSYVVIRPNLRGLGIGGPLLEFTWKAGAARLRERGLDNACMVWEIEIPSLGHSSEEVGFREKRREFFRRNGGILLSTPYSQPPLIGGEAIPMHLMYKDAGGSGEPDRDRQAALIRAIYREKYAAINNLPEELLENLLQRGGAAV